MLKRTNIDNLPPHFLNEEKEAFVKIYNALSICPDTLGLIPPVQGERTIFVVTEDISVSRETENAIDDILDECITFAMETISHDEIGDMEGRLYVFK